MHPKFIKTPPTIFPNSYVWIHKQYSLKLNTPFLTRGVYTGRRGGEGRERGGLKLQKGEIYNENAYQ